MVIGITGIFGAGKSTVLSILKQHGAAVVSSDRLVHQILKSGPVRRSLARTFGPAILKAGGEIDRRRLAALVFADDRKRKVLEQKVHPLVFRELKKRILDSRRKKGKIIAVEVPLLFETKSEHLFDRIIAVHATPERIRQRLKDKFTTREIGSRWSLQLPQRVKKTRADFAVDNSGPRSYTRAQVKKILKQLMQTC